ncbi:MAG TPA: M56 family metallopeptidase [Bryobacteraceae bacterium]|jgi:beta-lactamase regulating signal transducer with metallopeptidase domain|nr:M56 family metallopeptidase [Bryobacteraceae bacterium]
MMAVRILPAALAGALDTLWIALAIAGTAWALGRFLPRTNAATRHLVWWAVLALVLILPLAAIRPAPPAAATPAPVKVASLPAAAPAAAAVAPPSAPAHAVFPLELRPGEWMLLVLALWFPFALVQLLRIAGSFAYIRKVKRTSLAAPPEVAKRFHHWLAACGIQRPVRLLISNRVVSPMATGFRRPAVILPQGLPAQFQDGELDHVLLHELAHIARRDDWTNLLARAIGVAAGLHPVAAWTLRQIARERELACDDWVVARTGEARPYAASLARLFEVCRPRRGAVLATGMAENASRLGERIESLLAGGRQFTARSSLLRVGLASMALVALVAMGAQAPHWVVLAQSSSNTAAPARPVNPHGSFLAALVAAGYGDLTVDDIIALKDHGIDARFLADLSQSGWDKLSARDMIDMHDHGVQADLLHALHDAGFQHVEMRAVINAHEQGVRPATLKDAAQYGTHLTLAQIVKLKQAGVIQ